MGVNIEDTTPKKFYAEIDSGKYDDRFKEN